MRALLLLAALALVASGGAQAVPLGAGASGQCYDDAGDGGQDEARLALDTDDPGAAAVTVPTVTGAAAAVVELATSPNQHCENDDTLDYVEADARAGDTAAQVCYDGAVLTDGSCPTSPAGPGGPG